jgi:hypothetical protein
MTGEERLPTTFVVGDGIFWGGGRIEDALERCESNAR